MVFLPVRHVIHNQITAVNANHAASLKAVTATPEVRVSQSTQSLHAGFGFGVRRLDNSVARGPAKPAAGLEVARALRDASVRLDHTLEVIDFLAEEPSDYGLSCIGSRGMAGALDAKMLDMTEPHGETLRAALSPGRRQSRLFHLGTPQRHQSVFGIAH